jgi:hypothetical protein
MSSLAASKSDNFYFPPEWNPSMGSISTFQGSSGANQYEKYGIIRFELPFDGWCLGCGRHMSKGLRFNAKKERNGKYFTTTIWAFSMKCYSCDQQFLILTDPKNNTYDFKEGLRKHEQDYEANEAEGIVEVGNDEEKMKLNNDPMYKLQHIEEDKHKTITATNQIIELLDVQKTAYKKDYDMNSLLRKRNREKRKEEIHQKEEGKKRCINIPIVRLTAEEDKQAMQFLKESKIHLKLEDQSSKSQVQSQSIFSAGGKTQNQQSSSHTPCSKSIAKLTLLKSLISKGNKELK